MKTRTAEYISGLSVGEIKIILNVHHNLPPIIEILLLEELLKRSKDSVASDDR